MDFSNVRLKVGYSGTSLKSSVSFLNPFKEIVLNKKKKVVIERHVEQPGIWLEGEQIRLFGREFIEPKTDLSTETPGRMPHDLLKKIRPFESFTSGLASYL